MSHTKQSQAGQDQLSDAVLSGCSSSRPIASVALRHLPHFRARRTSASTPARGVPLRPHGLRFRAPVGLVLGCVTSTTNYQRGALK